MYDAEYDAEEDDMADYSGYDDNEDDDYTHNDVNGPEVVSSRAMHYLTLEDDFQAGMLVICKPNE